MSQLRAPRPLLPKHTLPLTAVRCPASKHGVGNGARGKTDHRMRKLSRSACESACKAAKCACFAYRGGEVSDDNCRFVLVSEFQQTLRSKMGFDAFVRTDVATGGGGELRTQHLSGGGLCGAGSGASLKKGTDVRAESVPRFYLYRDVPAFGDPLALSNCFVARTKGAWPWSSDKPGQGHLANAIWIVQALLRHPARVLQPEAAALILVPSYGALSEAVGACGGSASHFERMAKAAAALRAQPLFQRRPRDNWLVNAADTPRSLLADLGLLTSTRGVLAACLHPRLCSRFKPDRVVSVPWLPLPQLQRAAVRANADADACSPQRARQRPSRLFFRGSLGASKDCQTLRARPAHSDPRGLRHIGVTKALQSRDARPATRRA